MDPLSALRDYTIRGELDRIVRVNDEFRFGLEYSFPCSAETAYRSKQGSLYTLETLVFFVRNHQLKHIEYIQKARPQGIPAVTLPDRKPLLEYLQGKVSSSDAIEFLVPPNNVNTNSSAKFPDLPLSSSFVASDSLAPNLNAINDAARAGKPQGVDLPSVMTMIRAMERPLKDRESLLECKQRDFYSVLVASTKREEERQRMDSQQRKDGLVAKSRLMGSEETRYGDESAYDATPKPKMHLKGTKIGEGVPIILVPSAFQTLLTIYNVKEFLEDGVFIPTDVRVKQMKGAKPDCVTVQKKFSRDRVVTAYEVRDKPSALKPEDWDRVVAVFVLGKEWQFKDWPFKDHVEIFNKSEFVDFLVN
jgi:parafibromin